MHFTTRAHFAAQQCMQLSRTQIFKPPSAVELHEFNAYLSTIYTSPPGSTLKEVSQKVCQKADKLLFFKMYVLKILSFYNFSVKMTRQKTLER